MAKSPKRHRNLLQELPTTYVLSDWSLRSKWLMEELGLEDGPHPIDDWQKFATDVVELSKYFSVMILSGESQIVIALDERGYHFQQR